MLKVFCSWVEEIISECTNFDMECFEIQLEVHNVKALAPWPPCHFLHIRRIKRLRRGEYRAIYNAF